MAFILFVFVVVATVGCGSEARDTLFQGQTLEPYDHLDSGVYRLLMDSTSCTLKLFKGSDDQPVWESSGGGPVTYKDIGYCKLTLHNDSNLIISSPSSPVIWESGTSGKAQVNLRCRLHVVDLFGVVGMAVVHCTPDLQPYYNFLELPYWSTGMR